MHIIRSFGNIYTQGFPWYILALIYNQVYELTATRNVQTLIYKKLLRFISSAHIWEFQTFLQARSSNKIVAHMLKYLSQQQHEMYNNWPTKNYQELIHVHSSVCFKIAHNQEIPIYLLHISSSVYIWITSFLKYSSTIYSCTI